MYTNPRNAALCVVSGLIAGVCAAIVSIDPAIRFQTIEGFGALGGRTYESPYHDAAYVSMAVNDLGLSIVRDMLPGDSERRAYWAALKREADSRGVPLKFIASCWSPPAQWKTNNNVNNGGSLKPEYYDDYARYVVQYIGEIKQQCNVDVYAVSLQNEPAFVEPYPSCVYTAEQYRDLVKVAGPIIHAAYPQVKLFGAEDMLANWSSPGAFPGPLMADTGSRVQMGSLAVHGYSDGVNPSPASAAATLWSRAYRNASSVGKPLWMTETSGFSTDWNGAMQLGGAIYAALNYGKISAWVWWALSFPGDDPQALTISGRPTKRYYVSKQFYRYVRPGAVMVQCVSDDPELFACAFHHGEERTLTLVVVNMGGPKGVTLGGSVPASMRLYRTTSSEDCVAAGAVSSPVSVPGSSVVTLVAENYEPATAVHWAGAPAPRARAVLLSAGAERYTLRGERLSAGAAAPGVVTVRVRDGSATVAAEVHRGAAPH